MDWILNPTSVADKLIAMVAAIVLFVAIMALILWIIDRPKVPLQPGDAVADDLGLPALGDAAVDWYDIDIAL